MPDRVHVLAHLGLPQHHLLEKLGILEGWAQVQPRLSICHTLGISQPQCRGATTSGHLGHLLDTRLLACQKSYPGEVSRVTEARALLKSRVSQSFASRSRICGEARARLRGVSLLLEPSA